PLISSGNIRRLQREERPRGDPAGRSPRRLPSRPRKAKYISGAVYQHTLRHTDLALRKPKKAYKNRVLKILVPLRYREKLDTNFPNITLYKCPKMYYDYICRRKTTKNCHFFVDLFDKAIELC